MKENLVHVAPGSILPYQAIDQSAFTDKSLITINMMSALPQDFILNPTANFEAKGMLIYDDGLTIDLDKSTQIVMHCTGTKGNLNIDFHIVWDNALNPKTDVSTTLGSIIVLNSLKNGFDGKLNVDAKVLLIGEEVATSAWLVKFDTNL